MELQAKQMLTERLDTNLLDHAKALSAGDGPQIVDVYRLQGLAEMHGYLKTAHQFDPAEVEALLQFADPLNVAYYCGEMNTHEYSFPTLLPSVPPKPSVLVQLREAAQEISQRPPPEGKTRGGDAR